MPFISLMRIFDATTFAYYFEYAPHFTQNARIPQLIVYAGHAQSHYTFHVALVIGLCYHVSLYMPRLDFCHREMALIGRVISRWIYRLTIRQFRSYGEELDAHITSIFLHISQMPLSSFQIKVKLPCYPLTKMINYFIISDIYIEAAIASLFYAISLEFAIDILGVSLKKPCFGFSSASYYFLLTFSFLRFRASGAFIDFIFI